MLIHEIQMSLSVSKTNIVRLKNSSGSQYRIDVGAKKPPEHELKVSGRRVVRGGPKIGC